MKDSLIDTIRLNGIASAEIARFVGGPDSRRPKSLHKGDALSMLKSARSRLARGVKTLDKQIARVKKHGL